MGPWGEWHALPGTAAVQVRVRRSEPAPRETSYRWDYQFRSVLPRRVSFAYRVGAEQGGPLDGVARDVEPGGVVSGTVQLATAGPVWIDARLLEDDSPRL